MPKSVILLAAASVLSHCLFIFWPRKPLKAPLDENGLPILWRNDVAGQEDVARIWTRAAESPVALEDESPRERSA